MCIHRLKKQAIRPISLHCSYFLNLFPRLKSFHFVTDEDGRTPSWSIYTKICTLIIPCLILFPGNVLLFPREYLRKYSIFFCTMHWLRNRICKRFKENVTVLVAGTHHFILAKCAAQTHFS